jgi:hypothetical protein
MIELPRRSFLKGLGALFAAPAIVQINNLMPIRGLIVPRQLLTLNEITRQAIRLFKNSNQFLVNINGQYTEMFDSDNIQLRIRLPNDYQVAA